ncbi:RimJ/RimL family protein N-acetyltransferase [Pullulanibacillus pueri]|uniref:N-acetyltransferase n=2 Tax=Pullulanibacillus pueri TaxID=1437324 RepID=A0A8J3ELZ2_9BACL|nr:RimJ/RimL family protein N-acetyltransferase [Pullulanibacillus pueri]GGH81097.1 N-acetyltransferase [Pullulanibacillus pueri]
MEWNSGSLNNERLYLREFNESDWVGVHRYASQDIVSKYQVWDSNSEEETKTFVNQILKDKLKKPRTRYVFAIIIKKDDALVGAGEINIRDFLNKSGDIAYIVNPMYWGKGIATEAAKMLIGFGFEKLNLHRITAYCNPDNLGSKRVLEKAGLTQEGKLRENLLMKNGDWRDSLVYSILDKGKRQINYT